MAESDGVDAATLVLLVLGAIVIVPLLIAAVGFGGMMGYGMMGGYGGTGGTGGMGGWWPLVGTLVPLTLAVLLVVVGYLLVRRFAAGSPRRNEAVEELRIAYARGDLTDEEFERRRERLERGE